MSRVRGVGLRTGQDRAGWGDNCTHIYLTQNDVYYAANHDQGIKHIPGIAKITLGKER